MRYSLVALFVLVGCDASPPAPASAPTPPPVSARDQAIREVKRFVDSSAAELVTASEALCAAAPSPDADGWSAAGDAAAVGEMRAQWRRMRDAYERIEGAIQILFPQLDLDLDGRYEHYAELNGDPQPFDRNTFVGMHALERILWADAHDADVLEFERALPRYAPARTPENLEQATAFRDGLCARLLEDTRSLRDQIAPLALDAPTAWRGILGSIEEQSEKVLLAATGQTESRYSRQTLADMRANLAGGRAVLEAFGPLLAEHPEAEAGRAPIAEQLAAIAAAYDAIEGDALPTAAADFDPDAPDDSAYGRLFLLLQHAADPRAERSLAARLRATGLAMDIAPISR